MNILALVVAYKTRLNRSDTLRTLACQILDADLRVHVWDNSPTEASPSERQWLAAHFEHSSYQHDGRNTPLSTLYNLVIDRHFRASIKMHDYLILLDQDSVLEPQFIRKMCEAAMQYPAVDLLLPLVRAATDGHLVSPANFFYFKGTLWKNPRLGLISARFTTAINSGMMISADYLRNRFASYPEEISFYGTDNWFCHSYAEKNSHLFVVNTTIHHDLAQFGRESNDVKLWRHRQNVKALRLLNRHGSLRRCLCYLYTTGVSLRWAIFYRDWRFFLGGTDSIS